MIRFLLSYFIAGLLVFFSIEIGYASDHYQIYYFSPESNINNYSLLKREFDKYLEEQGSFRLQPFADSSSFTKIVLAQQNGLYLMSSWQYEQLKTEVSLRPLLVGKADGKIYQNYLLIVPRQIDSITELTNATLASSSSELFSKTVISQALHDNLAPKVKLPNLRFLTVPKDIDALMAVSFGMAKGALVSAVSYSGFKNINPSQAAHLKILLTGRNQFLPILTATASSDHRSGSCVQVLEKMSESKAGRIRLKMLGLDGWQRVNSSQELEDLP
jgi:hypothetical protein